MLILFVLLHQGKRTKRSGIKTFTLQIESTLKSLKLTPVGRLTTPSGLRGLGYWFFNSILQPRFGHKLLAHYCLFFYWFHRTINGFSVAYPFSICLTLKV